MVKIREEDRDLIYNHFRFIGTVDGTMKKGFSNSNRETCRFTLLVKDSVNPNKENPIPIIMYDNLAHNATYLCKSGNLVMITGQITTNVYLNKNTGETQVRTFFLGTRLWVIKKAEKISVNKTNFSDLTMLYDPTK